MSHRRNRLIPAGLILFFGNALFLNASSLCDQVVNNLIRNCGFETGNPADWTQGGSGAGVAGLLPTSFIALSVTPNSGNYSYVFGGQASLSQFIPIVDLHTYDLTFSVDSSLPFSGDTLTVLLDYDVLGSPCQDSNGCPDVFSTTALNGRGQTIDGGFTTLGNITFTAPLRPNIVLSPAYLLIYDTPSTSSGGNPQSGSVFYPFVLDDIILVDTTPPTGGPPPANSLPEPSSIALAAAGLLALGAAYRMRSSRKKQPSNAC
jgi:hypothetical protein